MLLLVGIKYATEWQKHPHTEQTVQQWQEVLHYAQHNLPLEGTIMRKSDGFVYVKVDDRYINELFPKLNLGKDFHVPPYFRSPEAPGAHISLFNVQEHVNAKKVVGQTVHFTLKDIKLVRANQNASYVILQVDAPELEQIRQSYGLSPKIGGKDFHISIAKKNMKNFQHHRPHHQLLRKSSPQHALLL